MLDILSLVACGWLLMYNPTDNLKYPITEWEQSAVADTAVGCEHHISNNWLKAQKEKHEFKHARWKCVPAEAVYSHTPTKK